MRKYQFLSHQNHKINNPVSNLPWWDPRESSEGAPGSKSRPGGPRVLSGTPQTSCCCEQRYTWCWGDSRTSCWTALLSPEQRREGEFSGQTTSLLRGRGVSKWLRRGFKIHHKVCTWYVACSQLYVWFKRSAAKSTNKKHLIESVITAPCNCNLMKKDFTTSPHIDWFETSPYKSWNCNPFFTCLYSQKSEDCTKKAHKISSTARSNDDELERKRNLSSSK